MHGWRLVCAIAVGATSLCFARESHSGGDARTFRLAWESTCGSRIIFRYDPSEQEVSFKKEPSYTGNSITRGAFVQEGGGTTIGFAYDESEKTIYLDVNRNWDLTDDGANAFKSTTVERDGPVFFPEICLSTGSEGDVRRYAASVQFSSGFRMLYLNSGWTGESEIAGRKWFFSLCDNMDGVIDQFDKFDVRATDDRDNRDDSGFANEGLQATQDWVLEGRQYGFEFKKRDDGSFDVVANPRANAVAELNLPGKDIKFLQLDGPIRLALPRPKDRVFVVPSSYSVEELILSDGAQSVEYTGTGPMPQVLVTTDAPATLAMGGPLQNAADVVRVGGEVQFKYKTVGIGGEPYQFELGQTVAPTVLAVYPGNQPPLKYDFKFG